MTTKKEWAVPGSCYSHAKECSYSDAHPVPDTTLYISPEVYSVVNKLCKDIEVEWQMLLTGRQEGSSVFIEGYWIPKQEVGGAHVHNLDVITPEIITAKGIVAGIHSHANMGVFFSPTDDNETNNTTIKHHIVCNNRGEFEAKSRYDLPCGLYKFTKAHVLICLPGIEVVGLENITREAVSESKSWQWPGKDSAVNGQCDCDFYNAGVIRCKCDCLDCRFGRHKTDSEKEYSKKNGRKQHAIFRKDDNSPKGPGGSLITN